MKPDLFTIVYCSRTRIRGDQSDIARELRAILASARTNNQRLGITGALLYDADSFAQVLEGPLKAIERIFEVIQRDSRHSDVTVIESGPLAERQFPEWSMALAGKLSPEATQVATAAFDAVFSSAANAGAQMLSLMQGLIVSDDDWVLLDAA